MIRCSRAFSLVELAIGLAVVTILTLSISVSAGVRDSARVQSAAASVQTLRSAAEHYLATGRIDYAGLDVEALKAAQLLPQQFSSVHSNPWGGDFAVAANASNGTRVDISLNGLSKADAEKLSAYFNNSASAVVFDEGSQTWTVTF